MIREDLSRNFGYLVNDVARLMRTVYDRRVRSLGLTRSQWWVLNHLFRHPGATQSALATVSSRGAGSMRKRSAPAATGSLSRTPTSTTRPDRSAVTAIMCAFT